MAASELQATELMAAPVKRGITVVGSRMRLPHRRMTVVQEEREGGLTVLRSHPVLGNGVGGQLHDVQALVVTAHKGKRRVGADCHAGGRKLERQLGSLGTSNNHLQLQESKAVRRSHGGLTAGRGDGRSHLLITSADHCHSSVTALSDADCSHAFSDINLQRTWGSAWSTCRCL